MTLTGSGLSKVFSSLTSLTTLFYFLTVVAGRRFGGVTSLVAAGSALREAFVARFFFKVVGFDTVVSSYAASFCSAVFGEGVGRSLFRMIALPCLPCGLASVALADSGFSTAFGDLVCSFAGSASATGSLCGQSFATWYGM